MGLYNSRYRKKKLNIPVFLGEHRAFVSDSLVKNETSCSKDGWQAGCLVPNRREFLQKPLWIEQDPSQTQNIVITNTTI